MTYYTRKGERLFAPTMMEIAEDNFFSKQYTNVYVYA